MMWLVCFTEGNPPAAPDSPFQESSAITPGTPRAFRSPFLDGRSQLCIMVANRTYLFTAKLPSLRCDSYIGTPQIDTQHFFGMLRLWRFILDLNVDEILALARFIQCCTGWNATFKLANLIVSKLQKNMLPTSYQCQAHRLLFLPIGKDSGIVIGASRLKCLDFLFVFKRSLAIPSYPINRPDRKVGRQFELSANVFINKRLNPDVVRQFWVNRTVDVVASIRERLQGCLNLGNLVGRRLEFAANSQYALHSNIVLLE